jgi:hypothetical protein
MTALDAADAGPVPMPFVAVTVNVYEVPGVRPVTTQLRLPGSVTGQVWPAGPEAVAV